ncbi:MAG: hypothetical protein IH948_00865, partial [Bacteroidetes bacterium]|nr:hypothetical protein [Bacteroidota bacterium]
MKVTLNAYPSLNKIAFMLLVLLMPFVMKAQTYPVEASTMIVPPYSIYYEDYFSILNNTWQLNLLFKDFNEVSRDVSLVLSLEGDDISIKTNLSALQNGPITLFPGVPSLLTGIDLRPYLNFNSIDVLGRTPEALQYNSRLPEGMYDFCVEIIDYRTGEVLSKKSCSQVWLQLNDEPTIVTPFCGSVVDPFLPLNIVFQWQQTGLLSANSLATTEYQLSVFEIIDPDIEPIAAVGNGQVIRVFQSEWSPQTSYLYSIASPALTLSKRYAYTVQARDAGGRDLFKNNGFSEVCWFAYGYQEGGTIDLTKPENEDGFRKDAFQHFSWKAPDNKMDIQAVEYNLILKEMQEGQNRNDAMENNDMWYEYHSAPIFHDRGGEHAIDKVSNPMKKGGQYAWQVEAFSGEQKVAESEVYQVAGPPILDEFYVQQYKIEVMKISNPDFNNLAGSGMVQLTGDGRKVEIDFAGLSLENVAGAYFLKNGTIISELEEEMTVMLNPKETLNDSIRLVVSAIKLSNDDGFKLKGIIKYEFPLITENDDSLIITTDPYWFMNINYMVSGNPKLDKDYSFDLLEPLNFTVKLNTNTEFFVIQNEYEAWFSGAVALPENVTPAMVNGRVEYPFYQQEQLFYMHEEYGNSSSIIKAVDRTNIVIKPTQYTLDFSDNRSPVKHSDDEYWKGVYLDDYNVVFKTVFTPSNSLNFTKEIAKDVKTSDSHNEGWITSSGAHILSCLPYDGLTDGVLFNTFPAKIDTLMLSVHNSELKNSYVNGTIKIPVISSEKDFDFTVPLALTGFTDGYLEEDLDGMIFTFNEDGGANKMFININRAVFVDKEYLEMDIDIDWPEFQVKMNSIGGFCAWGNYNIGFNSPGGVTTLTEQVQGKASGYDIIIDYIGAGREKNLYAIGTSANIVMGDDVAGEDGPPIMSAYSIVESSLLPDQYNYATGSVEEIYGMTASGFANISTDQSVTPSYSLTADANDDVPNDTPDLSNATSDDDEFGDIGSYLEGDSELDRAVDYTLEENQDHAGEFTLDIPEISLQNITYEDVANLVSLIKPFMNEEAQAKVDDILDLMADLEQSVLGDIYKELKESGFNINKLLKHQVDKLSVKLTDPIEEKLNNLTSNIDNVITTKVDEGAVVFTDLVEKVIQGIGDVVVGNISNKKAIEVINRVINGVKASATAEFKRSLQAAIHDNVTIKITSFIDITIRDQTTNFIQTEVRKIGYALIDKEAGTIKSDAIIGNATNLLREIGQEMLDEFNKVSINGVVKTIETVAQETYNGIDFERIGKQILDSIAGGVIEQVVADKIQEAVVGKIDKMVGGEGSLGAGIASGVLDNVSFNFDNIGEKVKNGELDEIVSFDPCHIKIKSKIADIEGLLIFKKADPVWGDSWQALLMAEIKKPEITTTALFLNGKVDNYNYWFLELNVESGLNAPMGPITLDGVGGKVFHHMIYEPETHTYKPY